MKSLDRRMDDLEAVLVSLLKTQAEINENLLKINTALKEIKKIPQCACKK